MEESDENFMKECTSDSTEVSLGNSTRESFEESTEILSRVSKKNSQWVIKL